MKFRFIITIPVILIILSFESGSFAQDNNRTLNNGIKDIYSFRMKEANAFFSAFINSNPSDPRGYYFLASLHLWKYLGNSNSSDLEQFIELADRSIAKCDKLISEENTLADALYFRGSMYGYKSIAYGKAEKYLEMIWASKNCTSDLNDVLKINPNYFDAYLGLGLFKFALSQVPSSFKWALNMIGFEGDMNQGLAMIRKTAVKGKLAKVEAQFYLAQILTDYYQSYTESTALLKDLTNKYPGNLLFQYSYAVINIKKRDLKPAEKNLKSIVENKDKSFSQIGSFSYFLLGDVNYFRNDYDQAIRNYNSFLASTTSREYSGIASLRIALSYEMTGDSFAAKRYYEKIVKSNWSNEEDLYAKRKSIQYLKRRPSQSELEVLKFQNMLEAGRYSVIIDSLPGIIEKIPSGYVRGTAALVLSDAAFNSGNYKEAFDYALSAVQSNSESESWIVPYGNYYAAKALYQSGNKVRAYEFLEKAEDIREYDFISRLKPLLAHLRNKFSEQS